MITIIISTFNRRNFLVKNINGLNKQNFKGQVIICDASNSINFKRTSAFKILLGYSLFSKDFKNLKKFYNF